MKKIIYSAATFCLLLMGGCSDHLDTENLYNKDLNSFYSTPKDIDEAMSGVYNALFLNAPLAEEQFAANLMSDLLLAGGGPDDIAPRNMDNFQDPTEDTFRDLWIETYNGVYRANAIIESVTNGNFTPHFNTAAEAEAFVNNALGEAHFMRGFLMYRAAKMFGGMPIIPTTDSDRTVDRSSFEDTFKFIATDMVSAISYMKKENVNNLSIDDYGHANVWIAKAYLAKIYLHYTGYMTNIEKIATTELPAEGASVTKQDAISALEDVINNSGYALASDYRNLWPYSYVNKSAETFDENYTEPILPWAAENNLNWVGQDGPKSIIGTGNSEVMFAIRYGLADWSFDNWTGQKYNNRLCLFGGVRGHSMVPFGEGWGWYQVNSILVNGWDDADSRKWGSVLQLGNAAQGTGAWSEGKGEQSTGFTNKKYTTLQHGGEDGVKGMFYYLYNMSHGDPFQLWAAQDFYLMRYSDVLLMHSELTETADGMNQVRQRAGLEAVAYTLDALKKERMYEFAFEGIRWFDLVRWGDVENEANNYFSDQIDVKNSGEDGTYSVTYRTETKGLVSIPETEIRLSNGVYKQNPGW